MTARYVIGDAFEVLATLPDRSVDLVLTSPPFLALRSYLPADHPDKNKEIGSEPTPGAFIDRLLDLTEEFDRVLTEYGTLAVELGDTYSGSGGAGGDYNDGGLRDGQNAFDGSAARLRDVKYGDGRDYESNKARAAAKRDGMFPHEGWPAAKSLCLIPESYRWALVYGRNPFTGRETPRWRARNVVRWCRPNPPVGALGDKFRPATSEMVVACKSARRWFDLDAVRTHDGPGGNASRRSAQNRGAPGYHTEDDRELVVLDNPAGAPPLDWWEIPTQGYAGSHYATWPERLCVRPIEAMCPREVCTQCGEPRRRVIEKTDEYASFRATKANLAEHSEQITSRHIATKGGIGSFDNLDDAGARGELYRTVGWTDCGHHSFRRGVVLDPFAGSGTTLAVAEGHGRDSIGIDLDSRNADLAYERVGGLFMTVETAVRS